MQEKTKKIILLAVLAIAIIAGVFAVLFATNQTNDALFSVAAYIMYAIIFIAIVAILLFALVQLGKNFKDNPKKAYKTVAIIVALGIVFLISWLVSSGADVSETMLEKFDLTQRGSKLVGAACVSVYILFFASLLSIVYVEVAKLLKK